MNPSTNTYAQNLRLRKIQNRQHNGQDKFSIGKRGEPIPGIIDPVTIARRQRRVLQRPVNLKKRLKSLENSIMWHQKRIAELDNVLKQNKNDNKVLHEYREHTNSINFIQGQIMLIQQSLNTILA